MHAHICVCMPVCVVHPSPVQPETAKKDTEGKHGFKGHLSSDEKKEDEARGQAQGRDKMERERRRREGATARTR